MNDLNSLLMEMTWPVTIFIAWMAGELGHKWVKIPRISIYAAVGFILAPTQTALMPAQKSDSILLLANMAFGLILFECGYRINLRWLKSNPWIGITSIAESILTAAAVYFVCIAQGLTVTTAMMLSSLSIASSPAAILRVINEHRSSGQVTERALHLSAMNCVIAVFAFKVVLGFVVFGTSGSLWQATYKSGVLLVISIALGAGMGMVMPAFLRSIRRTCQDSTLAFSIAVIALVSLTHALKLSPVLATLTFGFISRHRRIVMSSSQRGFGALGDLLSVLLFVFVASSLKLQHVISGLSLGISIIAARQLSKQIGVVAFSHVSGISLKKGLLTGLAITPLSAFVILVLEQTRHIGVDLVDQFAPLAATALCLEFAGPVCTWLALRWANEISHAQDA